VQIKDILQAIEKLAPPSYQESYDNSGLICGDAGWNCSGVMISLDALESIVDEAIEKNCNLVVAHHPIVFSGLKSITGKNYIERTLIKAIKNDIAIYAVHTNLDNVHNGVNKVISDKLELQNQQVLDPKKGLLKKLYTFCPESATAKVKEALFAAGAGHIGNYDACSFTVSGSGSFRGDENTNPSVGKAGELVNEQEDKIEVIFPAHLQRSLIKALIEAHPYEEVAYDVISLDNSYDRIGSGMIGNLPAPMPLMDFLTKVKSTFDCQVIRYTQPHLETIEKVAVCGGSGSFLLNKAIAAGADVFITADYKYHQFFDADGQIIIADIGHYESEQFTSVLLYEHLTQKFSNFAVFISATSTNPIKYL